VRAISEMARLARRCRQFGVLGAMLRAAGFRALHLTAEHGHVKAMTRILDLANEVGAEEPITLWKEASPHAVRRQLSPMTRLQIRVTDRILPVRVLFGWSDLLRTWSWTTKLPIAVAAALSAYPLLADTSFATALRFQVPGYAPVLVAIGAAVLGWYLNLLLSVAVRLLASTLGLAFVVLMVAAGLGLAYLALAPSVGWPLPF